MTITSGHTGSFTQGQTGATYTITASNDGTGPTSGTVTVTETVPAGLTATSIWAADGPAPSRPVRAPAAMLWRQVRVILRSP